MARRDRVGARQPGVQRHQARLGAEADDRGDDDQRLHPGALGGERPGVAQRAVVGEREHADPDAGAAEVGHRQVDEDGMANRGVAATHEDRGRPATSVISSQQARNEDGSRAVTTPARASRNSPERATRTRSSGDAGQVVAGEEERRHRDDREGRQEEAGQPVDPQRRAEAVAKVGADRRSAEEDEGAAGAEQRDARRLQSQRSGKSGACERRHRSGAQQQRAEHGEQFQAVHARGLPARGKTLD